MQLQGKTAIIKGGTLGIGLSIAEHFAEQGADVAVVGRNRADLDAAVSKIQKYGVRVIGRSADVSIAEQVNKTFDAIIAEWGKIDIVVNNAGICRPVSFLEMTEADWDQHLDINLKGTFLAGQRASKEMVKAGINGSIINVSSVNGIQAEADQAHYNASKGGMNLLTMSMALELAPHGIRVNALCPGYIRTRLTEPAIHQPDLLGPYLRTIPMGRVGETSEVAQCAVFLASDAASYMTGHCLVVDGGQVIKLS
jgi:NAD(P)-dependent dehydrogenase (short-subunit alcohol dehydrogenase family)